MNSETNKQSLWMRLKNWIKTHRTRTYILIGALLVVAASIVAFFILNQQPSAVPIVHSTPKPKKVEPPKKYYSPLTGLEVKDEAATKQPVTAIMIENSPDARPQSGVKQAGIVYEAVAEGGITRFLTLHQQDKPQMIGPVRSLRMYYVDWLAAYNASVAHIGGSAASLAEIRNGSYRDIDQFFNSGAYWRAADRYAPHNVYTSFDKLDALNKSKGYTESKFTGFPRTDGKASKTPNAQSVAINISGPLYNTTYTYKPEHNYYERSLAGEPHMDREDGHITPSVVIALKVNMTKVLEDGYRESIVTTGTGQAVIFQNGTAKEVNWKKDARDKPLTFTDETGKEILLTRGQTWISAIPNQGGSVSWQ